MTTQLESFALAMDVLEPTTTGGLSVRIVPWGIPVQRADGTTVQFDRGSVTVPAGASVPVTIDHGGSVRDRIGVMSSIRDGGDGLYGTVSFADTEPAQEIRALAELGAITDVSAGVWVSDQPRPDANGVIHLSGPLDHVSIVGRGQFSQTDAGARVLAVHNDDSMEDQMKEETTAVETPAVVDSPTVAEFAAQAEQIEALRAMVAGLAVPGAVTEPTQDFEDLREFVLTFAAANKGDAVAAKRMEKFALATDTTTTAAGLVPDYFSQDIIGIIDTQRPYLSSIMADPVGSQGMTAQYPRRTQKPSVDVQATQLTEVASQATTYDFLTVPLVSYAGASQVALQLIERSAPSFVTRLFQEYAGVYAEKTSLDAVTNLIANAAVGNTEILADFSTDPAATWEAVAAASAGIVAATRRNPDLFVVAPDRWGQLTSMLDTTKRPLVTFGPGGPTNAMGTGGEFSNLQANWNGLRVVVEPSAAAGSAILMWSGAANYLEQSPQEMRALQVSIAGMELGIWSLFAHIVKYPDGVYTFTTI